MKWVEIIDAVKSNFSVAVAFAFCFAAGFVFLWNENRSLHAEYRSVNDELKKEREEIYKKELEFKDMQILLEKEKSSMDIKSSRLNRVMEDTKALQDKLDKAIAAAESDPGVEAKKRELSAVVERYQKAISSLETRFSLEVKKENAEEDIRKAMRDFAALGVDIGSPDWCDKDYMRRYYHGVALIGQIRALNEEYQLSEQYTVFVNQNTRGIWSSKDGICQN
jgi:hypothetical protein